MIAGEILSLAAVFAVLIILVYNLGRLIGKATDYLFNKKGHHDD